MLTPGRSHRDLDGDGSLELVRTMAAVVLAGVVVLAVGCSSSDDTPATGTIAGTFVAVGGPPPGMREPLAGSVTISDVATTTGSTAQGLTVEVGDDGRFAAELAPGRYALVGVSPSVGGIACVGGPVDVTASRTVSVEVQCPLP